MVCFGVFLYSLKCKVVGNRRTSELTIICFLEFLVWGSEFAIIWFYNSKVDCLKLQQHSRMLQPTNLGHVGIWYRLMYQFNRANFLTHHGSQVTASSIHCAWTCNSTSFFVHGHWCHRAQRLSFLSEDITAYCPAYECDITSRVHLGWIFHELWHETLGSSSFGY